MRDWTLYWRSSRWPVEAMHAHFQRHAYELHSHETYSFGVTEAGAQTFRCRGAQHTSTTGMVMALNPDEPHDGHSAVADGFTYKIVHIGPEVVTDLLSAERRAGLPLFTEPVRYDPLLAEALHCLHDTLVHGESTLAQDDALLRTVHAMVRRGSTSAVRPEGSEPTRGLRPAVDFLHEHFAEDISAQQLAEISGRSRFSLHRAFRSEFGLAPSAYQRQLRLRRARRMLADGGLPAEVAAAVGFADQSHFTRWFRRVYGITPTVYRQAGVNAR